MSIHPGFKDNFNYLLGFLAAVLGLTVFKEEAIQNGVAFFGLNFSLYLLSLPLILSMLFAAYLGALVFVVDGLSFVTIPIKKYLQLAANIVATVGLLYPLLLVLLYVISLWVTALPESFASVGATGVVISVLVAVLAAYTSTVLAYNRQKREVGSQLGKLSNAYLSRITQKGIVLAKFSLPGRLIKQYSDLERYVKTYLLIQGFNVNGGLVTLAKTMETLGYLNHKEVVEIERVAAIRNSYVHNLKEPSSAEMQSALETLERLSLMILSINNDKKPTHTKIRYRSHKSRKK